MFSSPPPTSQLFLVRVERCDGEQRICVVDNSRNERKQFASLEAAFGYILRATVGDGVNSAEITP